MLRNRDDANQPNNCGGSWAPDSPIDQADLKGARYGKAQVSRRHANFIVAQHGATASDVLHLIDLIRERVRSVFGTELETEIEIWKPVRARRRDE